MDESAAVGRGWSLRLDGGDGMSVWLMRITGRDSRSLVSADIGKERSMAEMIGDFMMRIGAMKKSQAEEVIRLQKGGDARQFGVIAIELGYVKEEAVKRYLASEAASRG
jgi:hypothetical protein